MDDHLLLREMSGRGQTEEVGKRKMAKINIYFSHIIQVAIKNMPILVRVLLFRQATCSVVFWPLILFLLNSLLQLNMFVYVPVCPVYVKNC